MNPLGFGEHAMFSKSPKASEPFWVLFFGGGGLPQTRDTRDVLGEV